MPGPTSTLPGVSAAAVMEAEAALVELPDSVSVVPEMVALGRVTRGVVGRTESEDVVAVWLTLTTPVPVAGL